jgi:hypothetical protein
LILFNVGRQVDTNLPIIKNKIKIQKNL